MGEGVQVHPTAVVDPGAVLGPGTVVGPYSVIEDEVTIGSECRIESHAVIRRFTTMGDRNSVGEGALLGGCPQDFKFEGERSFLEIGDDNNIREGVSIHRATGADETTRFGSRNFLMGYSHVGHNCTIEDDVTLANGALISGHVLIERFAFVSGLVAVHQFTQIGRHAMVGGSTPVRQDALPFFTTEGNPARTYGLNLVGLKRRGFSREELRDLKRAHQRLFARGGTAKERLAKVAEIDSEHVRHLVAFIERSKRGYTSGVLRR
jgi:UDP-N-acetylglucosamine acyltransferase